MYGVLAGLCVCVRGRERDFRVRDSGQRDKEAEKQRVPGVKVSDPGCALEELPEITPVFLAFIFPLAHRRR